MKILFVYPGYIVREVPLNLMYVSAAAKAAGHDTRLFHFSPYRQPSWIQNTGDRIEQGFKDMMRLYDPDLVAFSVIIQDYSITRRLTSVSKEMFNVPVIWGGIEPILRPEKCIREPGVDFICTGEGEGIFPEFLDFIERDRDVSSIQGIWTKDSKGNMIENGRPNLISDLDELPFPDRDLLGPEYYQAELTGANILSGRGCPFPCSFCQNKTLMEIYKDKGHFVRYRSIENVFKELELLIDKYNAPCFYFSDEIFTLNKKRVIKFCSEYKSRIGRPFMIQTRVDHMNEELAGSLSNAGCFMVSMSIESGNDEMRNTIMKKGFSREQIYKAYKLVHDHEMSSTSFNMIGAPGETVETIQESIDINRELRPNRILCSIFMPLPGTELWQHCIEKNLMCRDISETTNYYSQVVINNPGLSHRTLIGYQGFFDWYVLLPKWMYSFIHILRMIYQITITPAIPKRPIWKKFREIILETVYQWKRFLPQKKLHIKVR